MGQGSLPLKKQQKHNQSSIVLGKVNGVDFSTICIFSDSLEVIEGINGILD